MRRHSQKVIAVVMSLLMLFSAVPQTAYAFDGEEPESTSIEFVIDDETEAQGDESSTEAEVLAPEDDAGTETEAYVEETESQIVESETETVLDEEEESELEVETSEEAIPTEETTEESETETTAETSEVETEEATEETEAVEEQTLPIFSAIAEDSLLSEEELNTFDFSSKRLLVAGTTIVDPENEISSYDGVSLMQYADETTAKYAYSYYYGKAAFVEIDSVVSIATGEGSAVGSEEMAEDANPFAELQEAVATSNVNSNSQTVIALIDTGINGYDANVIEAVSMLGDNTADENGHGTRMAELIIQENPNAQIISIKALGADGTGDVSAVYAAIQYAVEKGADIINLSISAPKKADSVALVSLIKETVANGKIVVAAAGNNGSNALYYVPGSIYDILVIGAATEDGERLATSNYGDTVDYNVVANSTSEAAARFTGIYSREMKASADYIAIFPKDYVKTEVDWNGPRISHRITFFDYENGHPYESIYVGALDSVPTVQKDGYIQTVLGIAVEDLSKIDGVGVYTDFANPELEVNITADCIYNYDTGVMKIPEKYASANLTVRWYMPNNTYMYGQMVNDPDYIWDNTPTEFRTAADGRIYELWGPEAVGAGGPAETYATHASSGIFSAHTATISKSEWDTLNPGDVWYVQSGTTTMYDSTNFANTSGWAVKGTYFTDWNQTYTAEQGTDLFSRIGVLRGTCCNSDFYTTGPESAMPAWQQDRIVRLTSNGDGVAWKQPYKGRIIYSQIICVAKEGNVAKFYFQYQSHSGQCNSGAFNITFTVEENDAYLAAQKVSANTAITNGNDCYPMAGLQFYVYTDSSCTTRAKDVSGNDIVLTTDSTGATNAAKVKPGTYYVREVNNSVLQNSGWIYNGNAVAVTVTTNNNENNVAKVSITNQIGYDPVRVVLTKVDEKGNAAVYTPSLANAEFTVEYYDGIYTTEAAAKASGNATKTLVYKTNERGQLHLQDSRLLVSGTPFTTATGEIIFPEGTLVIRETKAPTGYLVNNSVWNVTIQIDSSGNRTRTMYVNGTRTETSQVNAGQTADMSTTVREEQIYGGISVVKVANGSTSAAPQSDASLYGTVIGIYAAETIYDNYYQTTYQPNQLVRTITTDANGNASTGRDALVYGRYYLKEVSAPVGYTVNTSWRVDVTVNQDNVIVPASTNLSDMLIRGGVIFVKEDANLTTAMPQSGATLAGAEITIYAAEDMYDDVANKSYSAGDVVLTITTNEDGVASVPSDGLAYGKYYAKETKPSTGYVVSDNWRVDFQIKQPDVVVDTSKEDNKVEATSNLSGWTNAIGARYTSNGVLPEEPTHGNVEFQKIDAETGLPVAQGQASLEGAEITIYAAETIYDDIKDVVYQEGDVVAVGYTNADGAVVVEKLVYGAYIAKETSPSKGYTVNSDWEQRINVTEDGITIETDPLEEDIARIDVALTKTDSDGEPMAFIPFLIERLDENGDVIEAHVFVTDENGYFNSADRPKTGENVNNLDEYAVNGIFTDESKLTAESGIWFGDITKADESKGSLVYGNYRITELQCNANYGYDLLSKTMFESNDPDEEFKDGTTKAMTAFVNLEIEQNSEFIDVATGGKVVNLDEIAVKDTYTYRNLKVTSNYRLETILVYVDRDGNESTIGTASQNFTPVKTGKTNTANGVVETVIDIDTTDLTNGGSIYAVDNLYIVYADYETLLTTHNDQLNVESQILYVPYISTTARDGQTGDHVGTVTEEAVIIDTVEFENLADGKLYLLEGTLRYADTGEVVLGKDGNELVVTQLLRCSYQTQDTSYRDDMAIVPKSGTVDMPAFEFDASELGNRSLVVTEVLYDYDTEREIVNHYDLDDEEQTVHFVKVSTQAADENTTTRTAVVGQTTIVDAVTMRNLIIGQKYTVNGTLVYKDDCTDANGVDHKKGDVIATHEPVEVIATATEMTIEIEFTVDASALEGISGVVFEDVWHNGIEVATHHDYDAEEQTPNWPMVRTTAIDPATGTHTGVQDEQATIIDTVSLTNLTVGDTYKVVGTLMTSEGEEFLIDGEPLVVESESFEATETEMTVEIEFNFDATELAGQSLVVFEKLFVVTPETEETPSEEVEVARHEDPNDEDQTVDYIEIKTNANDGQTGDEVGTVGKTTIVDTVTYTNLHVGEEYTISGTLHYTEAFTDVNGNEHEEGETLVDADGNEIVASVTFTAETKNGTIDLVYEIDSTLLKGATVVVFETVYSNDVDVYTHADLTDIDQSVYYPDVKTTALDKKTETHMGSVDGNVELVDTVELTNLVVGKTYTVVGTLMDKETGEAILDADGNEITATLEDFEATETEMTVEVTFIVDDPTILYGKSTVVFEDLLHKGITVSYHKDIDDDNQTIDFVEVKTTATDTETESHEGHLAEEITIVDVVQYDKVLVGKEYTVKGILMDKSTGEPLLVNGKEVTAEVTFVAEERSGEVELEFTFDSTALKGKTVVAFEEIYYEDILVGVHADLEDVDQSVVFPEIKTTATDKNNGTHTMTLGTEVVLVDTITYTGLTPGKEYTVKGTIMDKETGKALVIDGKEVVAEATFTPDEADGTTTIEFKLNTEELQGKTLVVFEKVFDAKGNLIAEHEDIDDEDQTVTVPVRPTEPPVVVTGDTTKIAGWSLMFILALVGVAVLLFKRRKVTSNK